MKGTWLALATATSLVALPCFAQNDTGTMGTDTTTSTDTTMSGTAGTTGTMNTTGTIDTGTTGVTATGTTGAMSAAGTGGVTYTNVDVSKVRSEIGTLRGYLNRMRENNQLAAASGDIVHADSFRRTNEILLDNASSLALNILSELGPPSDIPPGLGEARDHMDEVASHLGHARMMTDYSVPVTEAKNHLDMAMEALDRGTAAMAGGNMAGSMGAGSMSGMSGMSGMGMGTMSGTMNMGSRSSSTTNPTTNQSNPGLNNYNSMNNAGTGVGATTSVPNTTPGQPGTGDTGTGTTNK